MQDALTGYIQAAAAANGWADARAIETLKQSIERAPLNPANVLGLIIVLALSPYVVFAAGDSERPRSPEPDPSL